MRCFVGIPLSKETRGALSSVRRAVSAADVGWRDEKWVAEENLHITLAFLGEVASDSLGPLTEAIGDELAGSSPFEVPFASLRAVPNARRASMLWAAYDDPVGACALLASAVARGAAELDVPIMERVLKPHVTLVRARRPRRVGRTLLDALESTAATVPRFMSVPSARLVASTLSKSGPHYEVLHEWVFLNPET